MFSKKRLYLTMGSTRPWLRWMDLWEDPELGWIGNKDFAICCTPLGKSSKVRPVWAEASPRFGLVDAPFLENRKCTFIKTRKTVQRPMVAQAWEGEKKEARTKWNTVVFRV